MTPRARSIGILALALLVAAAPAGAKGKKKPAPPVRFSGKVALRVVYDDNIIHYSDEDLREFETTPVPGKYSITRAGDWIVRPRLELTAKSKELTGRTMELRVRLSSWQYVENIIKNNESFSVRLKHPGLGKGNFQLNFYHAPESYLRNFRDRPPVVPPSTSSEYTDFSYTSTSLSLAHWRRLSEKLEGKLEVKRAWRYYNQAFMENDNKEWRVGGYLTYRLVKPLKVTGEYFYSDVEARAADTEGETRELSDDGDASYERDSYKLSLGFYLGNNLVRLSRLTLSGQYQAYYFTSRRPPDEDRYHVGRKDEMTRYEVSGSTRALVSSASLEGGYRYTERDSSAPWETGEGESIDEDKDYTDHRVWLGVEYAF